MAPRRRSAHIALVSVVARCLAATAIVALHGCAEPATPMPTGGEARVVRIIDGDTLVVRIGRATERVRLIGVDAPEVAKHGEPGECFGDDATLVLTGLTPPGSIVRIERDVEARDVYDRLLAYVTVESDSARVMVNRALLEVGAARTLRIEPNTARASEFESVAATARSLGVGLWGACGK